MPASSWASSSWLPDRGWLRPERPQPRTGGGRLEWKPNRRLRIPVRGIAGDPVALLGSTLVFSGVTRIGGLRRRGGRCRSRSHSPQVSPTTGKLIGTACFGTRIVAQRDDRRVIALRNTGQTRAQLVELVRPGIETVRRR